MICFHLFLFCHVIVFVVCQDGKPFETNRAETLTMEKYVKSLVEKEVKSQMEEFRIAQKSQEETIKALQSQIQSERQYRQELETRLQFLENVSKTAESGTDREENGTVPSESTIRKPDVSVPIARNNTHLSQDIRNKTTGVKRILIGQDPVSHNQVAFYAYMSHDLAAPSAGHILVFDVVKTNVGSGYNHHDGVFTAPSQVYVFSWTVMSGYHSYVFSELVVNSSLFGKILTNSQEINDEHVGTGVVVAVLNQGDVARVRVQSAAGKIMSDGNYYTSFSGWKLN